MVRQLLDRGANPEPQDSNGQTPLSLAVLHGNEAVIKLIREKGASLDPKENHLGQETGDMDSHE